MVGHDSSSSKKEFPDTQSLYFGLHSLERLVAPKVRDYLGGNMRLIITGGASLSQQVAKLFIGLGQNLIQGYGLTETSPIITSQIMLEGPCLMFG